MRPRIRLTLPGKGRNSRQNARGAPPGRRAGKVRRWVALSGVALVATSAGLGVSQAQVAPPAAPVGQGFNLNASDLRFILRQIKIAERHAATRTAENPCGTLLGPGPDQIPDGTPQTRELPWGLRTVDGSCNNLVAGREQFAQADRKFPRALTPEFRPAEAGDPDGPGPAPAGPTSYAQNAGIVIDSQPRIISNLIVDQTAANPAAVEAAGPEPVVTPSGAFFIPNVAPDTGLSAPFNTWFIFFGQFFDHGLDLVAKGGNGTVFMPLKPDDPLFDDGADNIPGNGDDGPNFMLLTRASHSGDHEHVNRTNPLVDQSQTYTSHPSHQVFLREYENNDAGRPVATGRLITGPGGGMSDWATVKAQARDLLGIALRDTDVVNVPLLATDPYGRFLRGPNGYPQLVKLIGGVQTLVEGDPAAPVNTDNALRAGQAFLDDIAHHATPGPVDHDGNPATPRQPAVPDADPGTGDDLNPATYDDEMLGAHFMAGDGRVNENLALTAVHHVFHSEHNRLSADIKQVLLNEDPTMVAEWQLAPGVWNGERIFQAARFVTEMEYQHLAFEEFIRKVQPMVNAFGEGGTGFHPDINPAIRAEFAHTVYRFGHSMLTEEIGRVRADGSRDDIALLDAFLNPPALLEGGLTADQAVGEIVRGTTRQVGQQIDEFVTEAVRSQLLGLPLDLPAINIARGRETGIPRLNEARRQFFAESSNSALTPYESWADFSFSIRNPSSLANFVAAYGTHPSITAAQTVAAKRGAAELLVAADAADPDTPADAVDFLNGTGTWASQPNGVTTTGVDDIDFWMGGLAEKPMVFGGMLGATFNYVFETQMEDLQDGDRFYYLSRTAGLNLLTQLEGNSFAELIQRNSDASGLPADVFARPDFVFDVSALGTSGPILDDPATEYDESELLIRMPNGTIRFGGGEHVVFNGTPENDRIWSSEGDDTIRGNDGDDWMQGGDGNDNHIGGLGDDTLLDLNGDDTLKGGDGNDTLSSGQGLGGDLNQGGRGSDFIVGGSDITETFAGPGDDYVFAGDSEDTVFGDDGDDWLEGGRGAFNLLQGDNGAPFQDDPNEPGHDVLQGTGGEQDFDAEGGDDVMHLGAGIQRAEGMLGFDWTIHKGDPLPGDSDMTFGLAELPAVDTNRDRFDRVEGLSGWNLDDTLRGDDTTSAELDPEHVLTPAGVARIAGLQDVLGAATSFAAGNIILGGAGSDVLEGRGGDDILDGDRWLDVQISVRDRNDPALELRRVDGLSAIRADVLSGAINPGQLRIVREIKVAASGTAVDTAVFAGPLDDYDIVANADASLTVTHASGSPTDGSDTLRNVERLRFADATIDAPTVSVPAPAVTLSAASLTFADQEVGTTSAAQTVTLTNTGDAPLEITDLKIEEIEGADPVVDFALGDGGDCTAPLTVAAGDSCDIEVTFAPTAAGPRTAFVEISSNAAGTPHRVDLTGNGTPGPAPVAEVSAASIALGDQIVGTASASQAVTLSNTGNAPLTVSSLAIEGLDFAVASNTCVAAPVAAGASCTIDVSFTPQALGARVGTLSISHDASATPTNVALSGNGIAPPAPAVTLAPTAELAFGDKQLGTGPSASQLVTVTNSGTAALTLAGTTIAGANAGDFAIAGNGCIGSLTAGASCTVSVTFTPSATGVRMATLQVASDAAGSPHGVALSGNAAAPPAVPGLVLALGFNEAAGGTALDSSGSGNNGVLGGNVAGGAGPAWTADGRFGGALSFNGTSSWVTVADANSLDLTNAMTVEAWVRPTVRQNWMTVLMKERPSNLSYALYANTDGATGNRPAGHAFTTSDLQARGPASVPLGAWSHLALTHDGTNLRLYVNGTLVATRAAAGSMQVSAGALRIGGNGSFVPAEMFNGQLDEIRVYNRALSAAEIGSDMNSPVGTAPAAPPADTTSPTVNVTAPAAGATVSGNVTVSANAADNVGVAGVQFRLDGVNLGAEDTTAPYSVAWDTTAATDAGHTLTAVVRDAAGNTATSAAVNVTVNNAAPAPALSVLLGNAATETRVDQNAPGLAEAFRTTAAASGSVSRLRLYVDGGSTAGSIVIGLYSSTADGHPGALLTSGTITAPVAGQDNAVTVPTVAVTAGETYWIAILGPTGTLRFRDRTGVGAGNAETSQQSTLTALPATWTTGTVYSDGSLSAVGLG